MRMRGDACHVSLVKLLINPANWSANPLEQVRVEDIEKKSPFYNSLHFSPVSGLLGESGITQALAEILKELLRRYVHVSNGSFQPSISIISP
jgi:hypothetical protein